MHIIKQIDDKDLYKLLELHHSLQQLFPTKHNKSVSALLLFADLQRENSLNLGLYNEATLVGFMNGYPISKKIFHWANLYVEPNIKIGAIRFIKKSEQLILDSGYTGYTADSILAEGKNILQRFGAKEI